eukprot:3783735-Pleurochrysis_carterae.AAC.1
MKSSSLPSQVHPVPTYTPRIAHLSLALALAITTFPIPPLQTHTSKRDTTRAIPYTPRCTPPSVPSCGSRHSCVVMPRQASRWSRLRRTRSSLA